MEHDGTAVKSMSLSRLPLEAMLGSFLGGKWTAQKYFMAMKVETR